MDHATGSGLRIAVLEDTLSEHDEIAVRQAGVLKNLDAAALPIEAIGMASRHVAEPPGFSSAIDACLNANMTCRDPFLGRFSHNVASIVDLMARLDSLKIDSICPEL